VCTVDRLDWDLVSRKAAGGMLEVVGGYREGARGLGWPSEMMRGAG
jgi:hypothetical protein